MKLSRLSYWIKTGLIVPPVVLHPGRKGLTRLWDFSDLVALRVIIRLRNEGVSLQAVRLVVAALREESQGEQEHPLASARLLIVGRDVMLARSDTELVSLLDFPSQRVFSLLALAEVEAEVRGRLADPSRLPRIARCGKLPQLAVEAA